VDFLRAVRKLLAPGGTCFLSTPNGGSLEASLLGAWWPMCKVHDHVSFPSPAGLSLAARASGLRVERLWSSGLPFEFPVSALTAARDRVRARRGAGKSRGAALVQVPVTVADAGPGGNGAKTALARFFAVAGPFDPTSRLLGRWGRAASLKARLTR
jgi:hypothetical protein